MKHFAAILFLSIFLFNLYGYQLLIDYWQNREDLALSTRIATDIDDENLVSIKAAAFLPPYAENSEKFEWADGEISIDGTTYKYVKRRIFKDSVEFLCIPHTAKAQLENTREQFFRLSADLQDLPGQEKNPGANQIKSPLLEYCTLTENFIISLPEDNLKEFFPIHTAARPIKNSGSFDHPPEYMIS